MRYSPKRIYDVLDRYADFGLPMQITEISVPSYTNEAEDEEVQAEILKYLYSMWFSHPSMEAIIYWDMVDGYEWTPHKCGFVRKDLTPKKAYYVIRELFEKTWHTEAELTTDAAGNCGFRGFYGTYEITVETAKGKTTQMVFFGKEQKPHFTLKTERSL